MPLPYCHQACETTETALFVSCCYNILVYTYVKSEEIIYQKKFGGFKQKITEVSNFYWKLIGGLADICKFFNIWLKEFYVYDDKNTQ